MNNVGMSNFYQTHRWLVTIAITLLWLNTGNSSAQQESNSVNDFSKYEKKFTWKVSKELVDARSAAQPANNFDEAKVPNYTLPDIFTLANGKKVATTAVWDQQRRSELLNLFRTEVYGFAPPKPDNLTFRVVESDPHAMGGKATLKRVAISFQLKDEPFTFHLTLFVPNHPGTKSPVFLELNHRGIEKIDQTGDSISDFWPAKYVIERGYAIAVIDVSAEVEPDEPNAATGIRVFYRQHYAKPDELTWGALSAWGWAGSRAIDYFEIDPDVNAAQVAMVGHSRGGKAALWAGAQDTRIALTCSNCSGEGGSSLSRRRFGNYILEMTRKNSHWFAPKYKTYAGNESTMPFDQHMVVALVAPRGYQCGNASEDLWADPRGSWLSLIEASKVWVMYGKAQPMKDEMPLVNDLLINGHIAYHMREGGHNLEKFDWKLYLDHADVLFKKNTK
ncbi:MAG: acetylxylan esterase [Bacteroidia bacterium]|nr:acetylxylan esterase [Bacteroidia bacterium]